MSSSTSHHAPEFKDAASRLEVLRKETRDLEAKIKAARGTSAIPPVRIARGSTPPHTKPASAPRIGGDLSLDLSERIEAALHKQPQSIADLSRDLHESVGRIAAALKPLRSQLYNVGTEHDPMWFLKVGDHTNTEQLGSAVEALIKFRPMTFGELLSATGARQGRVSGAIVAMQRDPKSRIVNLGNQGRARWFWLPDGIQPAKLKPR